MAADSVYDACAAFAAEVVAQGVKHAVISPGSRSAPLALTLADTPGLQSWIRLDERSAAFFAVGLAKSSGEPVVLACTSGTAAANYLPAITEAHWSETPLIILTANRPPELRGWGAGQTIDQTNIYGSTVRWFAELPIADDAPSGWFQRVGARAVQMSTGLRPGPVHLDWPFREPLEPLNKRTKPQPMKPLALARSASGLDSQIATRLAADLRSKPRGIVVAGPMSTGKKWKDTIHDLCRKTGYPLLAEPLSQLRVDADDVPVINHHDHLLRSSWAANTVPDIVIRLGGAPTCKPLRLWMEQHRAPMIMFDPSHSWTDPSFTITEMISTGPEGVEQLVNFIDPSMCDHDWGRRWVDADGDAAAVIDDILDSEPLLQPAIARELGRQLPDGHLLYVSNSMPVRDVDSFLESRSDHLVVLGNRGASGIDGMISSAAGAAASGHPTTLLIGDLAFQHDFGGLIAAVGDKTTLTIVVIENQGGGIFDYLPISEMIDGHLFHTLFRTPQALNIGQAVEALGVEHIQVSDLQTLGGHLAKHEGLRVISIPVDPDLDRRQHDQISQAIENRLR
ncbi:MAG: 2-succinyl-5-enolpyruvyl-6-hydroxy-3-cyclohexene-1-carboxylic-acid synthase [Actinomycetota bacterium]|nr:2-succinyl-5-enolpyruvyl-6-hydroxy-3-cyclohexene-1-carboxylic-acid synthase [Actinomycetota bacterium]